MKNKKILAVIATLCFIASKVMHNFINDSHLSELGDFFWLPLLIGFLALIGVFMPNKQS